MTSSSRDSDPLLRAIATGDEHCPDGKALARLGRLIRGEGPVAGDVRERVAQRLAVDEADVTVDEAAAIDRHYDERIADPALERLGDLAGLLRPAPADLRDRVRKQLVASLRLAPVSAEAPVSSRAQAERAMLRGQRLRIILGVAGVHAAALLAFAVVQLGLRPITQGESGGSGWADAKPLPVQPVLKVPERLPASWRDLPNSGFDLLALRRSPELRTAARQRFGMERSAGTVACGLRWLLLQQDVDGRFVSGTADAALASHALATLALLGEGTGDSDSDRQRVAAVARALPGLATGDGTGQVPRSLATLARVEAALLAVGSRAEAEAALADLARNLPLGSASGPGAGGVGGFTLLAAETAHQAGFAVPPVLLEQSRAISALIPAADADVGRVGLAGFARLAFGWRENPGTTTVVEALDGRMPSIAQGDALGWFPATLAAREAGGPRWDAWVSALQSTLLPLFSDTEPGVAMVPASAVHHAPDDVFATAIAVLDLQAAYRYLPLAASGTPPGRTR